MQRATIRDVAERAGVSIATVSLVLNNREARITPETRTRVLDAVKELDYRSNQLAVSMITKRSHILGLIIPDSSNMFFAELSRAITDESRKQGYAVIYGSSDNSAREDLAYLRMFADHQVDGIIMSRSAPTGDGDKDATLRYIRRLQLPFIMVDRIVEGSECQSVVLNHQRGGYLATSHLLSQGHRRIGCFTGPSDLTSSNLRLEGYREAIKEAGIPFDSALVFRGDYQLGREEQALDRFLEQKVSAVFSFNDMMAVGLYREMAKRGLSVPGDLSIVGFDNIPFSDMVHPPLTTVRQPIEEMAGRVVENLLKVIDGKVDAHDHQAFVFEPKLIVRESTAHYSGK